MLLSSRIVIVCLVCPRMRLFFQMLLCAKALLCLCAVVLSGQPDSFHAFRAAPQSRARAFVCAWVCGCTPRPCQ